MFVSVSNKVESFLNIHSLSKYFVHVTVSRLFEASSSLIFSPHSATGISDGSSLIYSEEVLWELKIFTSHIQRVESKPKSGWNALRIIVPFDIKVSFLQNEMAEKQTMTKQMWIYTCCSKYKDSKFKDIDVGKSSILFYLVVNWYWQSLSTYFQATWRTQL